MPERVKTARIAEPPVNQVDGHRPTVDLPYLEVPEMVSPPRENNRAKAKPFKSGPAYKTLSPMEEKGQSDAVINKVLDTPVTLTTAEIMSSSKSIREGIKNMLTARRKPTPSRTEEVTLVEETNGSESEGEDDTVHVLYNSINVDDLPFDAFMISDKDRGDLPHKATVIGDPVLQYLGTVPEGEVPRQLVVARDSVALRAIYPLINGVDSEESTLDGGSQIVSMCEKIALNLDITWDPDITITMQSANKQCVNSLGLARNVPFNFGDRVVVHLQVHIIRDPAYKVLLGRPFDVLTASNIQNARDGGQTIIITDPLTSKRTLMNTHAKGGTPRMARKKPRETDSSPDFQ